MTNHLSFIGFEQEVTLWQFSWMCNQNLHFQQMSECHQPSRGHIYKEKKRDALRYYCNMKHFVFLLDNTCRCVTAVCVSSFLFLLMQSFFQLTTVTLQPEYNCKIHLSLFLPVCLSTCLSDRLAEKLSVCQIFYPSVWLIGTVYLPVFLTVCTPVYLSVCHPVYLSVRLTAQMSFCLPVCLPVWLYTYLTTFLFLHLHVNHLSVPLCADHLSVSLCTCPSTGTSWQKALTQLGLVR